LPQRRSRKNAESRGKHEASDNNIEKLWLVHATPKDAELRTMLVPQAVSVP
jgi:hypothetical protein